MRRRKSDPFPLRGAIVAVTGEFLDSGNIIGVDGDLPWISDEKLKQFKRSDLKQFKHRTMGCIILMGRKTWDAIGRKELPGRRNIVISSSEVPEVECYDSIKKAIDACGNKDFWVIGGSQIYKGAMEYLNLLDVTYMPFTTQSNNAVTFPKIDLSCWKRVYRNKLPRGKKRSEATRVLVAYRRVEVDS